MVRDKTRRQRYAEKQAVAERFPVSLVTVEFHCDLNLGMVLRAAACFGAAAVHVIGSITPHAELKRVSGSTEELTSIIQHRDPAAFLGWRHENDPTSELVVSELREGAQSVHDFRFAADRHTFIAVGNETAGVPEELVFRADTLVYIPMPGPGFCLNTSQTANVLLFEYVRQANEHRNATNVSAMVG
jgi:tRNA G18 (ribose-2'-O)-methylase SpoU